MANHLELYNASHQWNINFFGMTHDWEMDLFTLFFTTLYSIRVRWGGEDRLCWVLSRRGLFDVRFTTLFLFPMIVLLSHGGVFGRIWFAE